MRTDIFYFSGSGNTLALARELAGKLGNATLISIPSCKGQNVASTADAIGIFFPVYAFGMPHIMEAFVENLKIPEQAYVFGVANYGGAGRNALLQLKQVLKNQQRRLHAGFGITMPSNYTPFGGAETDAAQKRKFRRASTKIAEIADTVIAKHDTKIERTPFLPFMLSHLLYRWFLPHVRRDVKKFYATNKCIGCGLCVRVCPTDNIALHNKRPVWGNNCEQCLACLQWCATGAIELSGRTEGKQRYHHPDVTVDEIIVAN